MVLDAKSFEINFQDVSLRCRGSQAQTLHRVSQHQKSTLTFTATLLAVLNISSSLYSRQINMDG